MSGGETTYFLAGLSMGAAIGIVATVLMTLIQRDE